MRNCPHCLNTAVIEDGYCGHCRQTTLPAVQPNPETQTADSVERQLRRELRDENRKLSESQTFLRRILAAVAEKSGGEIIVDPLALANVALDPVILTWTDEQGRLHIKVKAALTSPETKAARCAAVQEPSASSS